MTIAEQLGKIRENWLIAAVIIAVLLATNFSGLITGTGGGILGLGDYTIATSEVAYRGSPKIGAYYPSPIIQNDFAPDATERKLTKTAAITSEIERGKFAEAEAKLKNIIKTADAFLLNENTYTTGEGAAKQKTGNYYIKVESKKYEAVTGQLKETGKITAYTENTADITGQHTSLKTELEAEKARLERYQKMYAEATTISEKIELNDRIFQQERTVKYLEQALTGTEQQVDYSTIQYTLTEKSSGYAGIAVIKLSQLAKNFINSLNSLLQLLVMALPYAAAAGIGLAIYKITRKKRR